MHNKNTPLCWLRHPFLCVCLQTQFRNNKNITEKCLCIKMNPQNLPIRTLLYFIFAAFVDVGILALVVHFMFPYSRFRHLLCSFYSFISISRYLILWTMNNSQYFIFAIHSHRLLSKRNILMGIHHKNYYYGNIFHKLPCNDFKTLSLCCTVHSTKLRDFYTVAVLLLFVYVLC